MKNKRVGLAVFVSAVLLIVVVVFFLVELFSFDEGGSSAEPVSATAYRERLDVLLAMGNPANAEPVFQIYGCVACHRVGAANGIAPSWEGIAERAASRRPPMPADAYLYESIIHPDAYLVEGFPNSMVPNLDSRMSDQELADVIAYLLTPEAQ